MRWGSVVERTTFSVGQSSLLSNKYTSKKDVEHKIGAVHGAFEKLIKRVLNKKDLNSTKKTMVYNAVVISTLQFSCETTQRD
uniref:Uncharacterized protein n=1 Tax=Octopus bimaculoides TaxID=37653 RepID=A0A0L8GG59_OCTBM